MKNMLQSHLKKLEPLKDFGRDLTEEEAKELDKELEELEKNKES